MARFFIIVRQLDKSSWCDLVDRAVERSETFALYFVLSEKDERPGSSKHGYSEFATLPGISETSENGVATLNSDLRSPAGPKFLERIKNDLPGIGNPLTSYDMVSSDGNVVLEVRDLNDVVIDEPSDVLKLIWRTYYMFPLIS